MKANERLRKKINKTITCEYLLSDVFIIMNKIATAKDSSKQIVMMQYKVLIEIQFL